MDNIIHKLKAFTGKVIKTVDCFLDEYDNDKHDTHFDGWTDRFWRSNNIRKCHIKTIDKLEDKKLWLLHINIFPHSRVDLPILGCDIVAGPNKISGCFFDFSPIISESHPLIKQFAENTEDLTWKKPRELPLWAQEIFSQHMIAAGSVKDEEVDQLCETALRLIVIYLGYQSTGYHRVKIDTTAALNKYCINQKKNDKLHKSILAMGVSEEDKNRYVNNVLFEEI